MLERFIPKPEDLWFREKMLTDPATMSYNMGYEPFPGYHADTGCIDFPKEKWENWHGWMMNHEPERFFAYVRRKEDGQWVGDVAYHHTPKKGWWDMELLIYAPYRGLGYGTPALTPLLDRAFQEEAITQIHNYFETSRKRARSAHLHAGFREVEQEQDVLHFIITREQWLRRK